MLYDPQGNPLPDTSLAQRPPLPGIFVRGEASDVYDADESRALTPERVDAIMTAANCGDIERQAKLACEIEEKSWDIAQAVQTRRLAVAGLDWSCEPPEGDESPLAAEIAEATEQMLRAVHWDGTDELDSFDQALRYGMQGALLPGFAVEEMIWSKGGAELLGFQDIEQRHFIFRDRTGRLLSRPLLRTTAEPNGIEIPAGKFCCHYHRARPGARCRGGMIRPLAWIYCFTRINVVDLLTFIERYGMPFLIAKVSSDAWAAERSKLKALVKAFGPAGGAVLTENVTTELLQASNNTGDVYFKLLEYMGQAATKVVLGQLASSAEASGLSKGTDQSKVRQDLLEADARSLENTTATQILGYWTQWNYGPNAPVARLHLHSEPPEDTKALADTAASLKNAGLEWDPDEASERTGMKLTRREPSVGLAVDAGGMAPASSGRPGTPVPPPSGTQSATDDALALADPSGVPSSRSQDSGGSKPAEAGTPGAATTDLALADFLKGQGLRRWFGPLQAAIEAAVGEPDPATFRQHVLALTADLPGLMERMDSTAWEEFLEGTIYQAAAAGMADEAARLQAKAAGKGAA